MKEAGPQKDDLCSVLCDAADESPNPQPIHVLPRELLAAIFALASASTLCVSKREPSDLLLVVSAVCKRWRQIAIGTKTLWSHIDVTFYRRKDDTWSFHIRDATLLWLRRAEGTPIHLHFRENWCPLRSTMPEFTDTLEPHATRISALTFSGQYFEGFVREILNLLARHAMLGVLRSLTIRDVLPDSSIQARPTWPTARLHGLTCLQIGHVSENICFNLHQLTTILANNPSLNVLRLKGVNDTLSEQGDLPTIHLPSLRFLSLIYIRKPTFLQLLSILSPGAPDLHVKLKMQCDSDILVAVRAFLKRSKVFSLSLHHGITELAEDLSSLPSLHTLHLDIEFECEPKLCWLVGLTLEGRLVPKYPSIRHLGLIGGSLEPPAQKLIERVVETYELTGLAFMDISWGRTIDSKAVDFVDSLIKRLGVPVTVNHLYDSDREWDLRKEQRRPWLIFRNGMRASVGGSTLDTLSEIQQSEFAWF